MRSTSFYPKVKMELEKAKQILNTQKEEKYSDDEVKETLKLLSVLADVLVNNWLKEKRNEKSHNIC